MSTTGIENVQLSNSADALRNKISVATADIYKLLDRRFANIHTDDKSPDNITTSLSEAESRKLSRMVLIKTQNLREMATELGSIAKKMEPVSKLSPSQLEKIMAVAKADSEKVDPEESYPGHAPGDYEDHVWEDEEEEGEEE